MTLMFRLSNSDLSFATEPSSVVQTGVKSFGCENSIAHLSPIQSWNLIGPSVVSAVKSGAVAPSRSGIHPPHTCLEMNPCYEQTSNYTTFGAEGQRPKRRILLHHAEAGLW